MHGTFRLGAGVRFVWSEQGARLSVAVGMWLSQASGSTILSAPRSGCPDSDRTGVRSSGPSLSAGGTNYTGSLLAPTPILRLMDKSSGKNGGCQWQSSGWHTWEPWRAGRGATPLESGWHTPEGLGGGRGAMPTGNLHPVAYSFCTTVTLGPGRGAA